MKLIKVQKNRGKQIGIRLNQDLYDLIVRLSKHYGITTQEVISYILTEEIENYLTVLKKSN